MKYRIDIEIHDPGELSLAGALWDMSEEVSFGNLSGRIKADNAVNAEYTFNITEED